MAEGVYKVYSDFTRAIDQALERMDLEGVVVDTRERNPYLPAPIGLSEKVRVAETGSLKRPPLYADGSGQNTLRLSYSSASQEPIEEGRPGCAPHAGAGAGGLDLPGSLGV